MARTGPQKIPGASQSYFFGAGQYSGSAMEVNCGVIHTTEGMSLTSYSSGAVAPNVTGVPDIKNRKIRWYQHFDVDESARALMNRSGGVETNTANVFQIELVGTCDDSKKTSWSGKKAGVDYLHWPTAPDWALAEVAWLVRWLNQQHGIPLTCVSNWLAYGKDSRRPGVTPASYGANPARMSMSTWRSFTGWCGHQHVPENDHGDPGSLNFARVIALAKGGQTPATEEDDVSAAENWGFHGKLPDGKTDPADALAYLRGTNGSVRDVDKKVDALTAKVDRLERQSLTDEQVAAIAAAVAAHPALAQAIADTLATRLKD